jgi:acetate kinase
MTDRDLRVLVVNAGSSSTKLRVLEPDDRLAASADLPAPNAADVVDAVEQVVRGFGRIDAVGHRVVHGGMEYRGAVRVDGAVRGRLQALTDLAPLHQPKSLAALDAVSGVLPGVPHIACFDTAFHATLPDAAATYAIPADWRRRWSIRRYGFHGLSHAYAARRAVSLWAGGASGGPPRASRLPRPFRLVTCHLGAGASLAAVVDGRSVDTTMGFTPLEGLVMATRSGSVDPGLLLWLQMHAGLTADEVTHALDRRSGLLGLAGSADMRDVIAGVDRGEPDARLAFDVYVQRLASLIAAMAASAGGLDALVFTGGVGERAAAVRRAAAERLAFLGVDLEDSANGADGPADREIGTGDARVRCFVVEAREDLEIARQVREVLAAG